MHEFVIFALQVLEKFLVSHRQRVENILEDYGGARRSGTAALGLDKPGGFVL